MKIPEDQIVTVAAQPGKMLLVDLEQGRLIPDDEIKADLAKSHPYSDWLHRTQLVLEDCPTRQPSPRSNLPLLDRQQAFGYTQEDINILMTPMAATGEEARARWAPTRRSRRCRTGRSCSSPTSSRISRR